MAAGARSRPAAAAAADSAFEQVGDGHPHPPDRRQGRGGRHPQRVGEGGLHPEPARTGGRTRHLVRSAPDRWRDLRPDLDVRRGPGVPGGDPAVPGRGFGLRSGRPAAVAADLLHPGARRSATSRRSGSVPAYRLDRYATAGRARSERRRARTRCPPAATARRRPALGPFDGADGTAYYGGPRGCAGLAPDQSVLGRPAATRRAPRSAPPRPTAPVGDLRRAEHREQRSLGCSHTVPAPS